MYVYNVNKKSDRSTCNCTYFTCIFRLKCEDGMYAISYLLQTQNVDQIYWVGS